jgi:anhydro-N-acetylmuramic acid kinase
MAQRYIGLMSGTSLDGIDAVVADLDAPAPILASHYQPFPAALRSALQSLLQPGHDELNRSADAANELARQYAQAVHTLLDTCQIAPGRIRAIGCHGQTVRHQPQRGFSLQLVNAALLAETTGVAVVSDFRSRDIAAGGQGAPLVPAFHASAFRDSLRNRAIVNLGGIANITHLPVGNPVTGFDCGPGNGLLDEWIELARGLTFDAGGAWGAGGQVIAPLLAALQADPYFIQPPPKSTGREAFNLGWLRPHLEAAYQPQDVQATLAELTARALCDALDRFCHGVEEVYLCGGGVANLDLVDRIRSLLRGRLLASTAALGVDPDWVEALAFAWLARETLAGRAGNLPEVTGARGLRVLGCVTPAMKKGGLSLLLRSPESLRPRTTIRSRRSRSRSGS